MKKDEFEIFRNQTIKESDISQEEADTLSYPNLDSQKLLSDWKNMPILIIDDDINVLDALTITLGKKYKLILCRSADEGIKLSEENIFTVILDIKLEGKNGFETFIEIKKKKPYVPIILHSAYQDLKDPFEIMNDYQPFGYIIKDGDNNKLLHTIESAFNYYCKILENKTLLEKLEKSERDYRNLVENSLDIIFSLNENWQIITINQSVTQILRYPVEEILNTSIVNLTYKSNSANGEILEEKLQELTLSNNVLSFNCDFVTKFGEPKEMHVKLRYFLQENGFTIFGTASTIEEDILLRICESETQVYKLSNFLSHVDIVSQRIAIYANKYCTNEVFLNLKLCLRELLINAMEHGNLGISFEEKSESLVNGTYIQIIIDKQKDHANAKKKITVKSELTPQKIEVTITDEGEGFDHKKMMARSMHESENQILSHGRGLAMAKVFLDSITFNEKGNSVHIIKYF